MKKRKEMVEKNTIIDHVESIMDYVDTCKTVHKKAREDTRKHNVDEMPETIEASKSLKRVRRTHSVGKNRMITLLNKQCKDIQDYIPICLLTNL